MDFKILQRAHCKGSFTVLVHQVVQVADQPPVVLPRPVVVPAQAVVGVEINKRSF